MLKIQHAIIFVALMFMATVSRAAPELPDFTELVDRYSPSVVKITTATKAKRHSMPRQYGQEIPEIFRHFFGDPRLFQYDQPPRQGMGSGFIIDADGYILTNNHVVEGADVITVLLNDRDEYTATLVGVDPRSDLALIKINAENLPALKFASKPARVGEWVVAIGSPFGLDYSVSQGIVSAIGRSLPTENNENYVPFIQTDVAINPGNSGGPLFNLSGEVVGINSMIYSRSGGYMGLSFAIPAHIAKNVVKQLRDNGYVSRGWLGVSIRDVSKDDALAWKLEKPRGALVSDVVPGSPAETAGLEAGDVILEFEGHRILKSGDLPHVVGATAAGTVTTLQVMRRGEKIAVSVELGELPGDTAELAKNLVKKKTTNNVLGLAVETINDAEKKELAIPGGVVVLEVDPDSPAAATGLMPGDIITQLGFTSIDDKDDFDQQMAAIEKGTPQPIRFFRRGHPVFRTILVDE